MRIIPLFYPKGNGPTPLDHWGFGYFLPVFTPLDFKGRFAWLALLERVKLSGQFQRLVVNRVKSEANDFISGDLGHGQWISPFLLLSKGRDRKWQKNDGENEKPDE